MQTGIVSHVSVYEVTLCTCNENFYFLTLELYILRNA